MERLKSSAVSELRKWWFDKDWITPVSEVGPKTDHFSYFSDHDITNWNLGDLSSSKRHTYLRFRGGLLRKSRKNTISSGGFIYLNDFNMVEIGCQIVLKTTEKLGKDGENFPPNTMTPKKVGKTCYFSRFTNQDVTNWRFGVSNWLKDSAGSKFEERGVLS